MRYPRRPFGAPRNDDANGTGLIQGVDKGVSHGYNKAVPKGFLNSARVGAPP